MATQTAQIYDFESVSDVTKRRLLYKCIQTNDTMLEAIVGAPIGYYQSKEEIIQEATACLLEAPKAMVDVWYTHYYQNFKKGDKK